MLCHNCGAENPQGRRFCEECGERLSTVEHRREKDRTRARRAAAKARIEDEGLSPAEKRRRDVQRRKSSLKIKPGRALLVLGVVVIVAVLIVVLVLAFAGSASAPEKAVQAFLGSLEKRDMATYLQYTDPVTYEQVKKQGLKVNADDYLIYASYQISGIKLQMVSNKADTAQVNIVAGVMQAQLANSTFSPQSIDFGKYPRTAELTKVNGSWIITNYQDVQLPYELPTQTTPEAGGVDEGI